MSVVHDLTSVVVPLLKNVLYRDDDPALWAGLLALQARVRDYVAVLNLDLVLDESEDRVMPSSKPAPSPKMSPPPSRRAWWRAAP